MKLEEKIRDIVNSYDPIGLLAMGCPKDEYSPEIEKIIPLLGQCSTLQEFQKGVYAVFVEMFDEQIVGLKENYTILSEEIYRLKSK